MTAQTDMMAPRAWARVAGICWLFCMAAGIFAEGFVRAKLVVRGDAAATMHNILASEGMYRLASAAMFPGIAAYLVLTAILYRLLAPVSRTVSLIAALFSVAGCTIGMFGIVFDAAPLTFFTGSSATPASAEPMQSLAFGLLRLEAEALRVGMLCFGVQCLLAGYLIVRSTFLPRLLGLLLAIGGAGYLASGLAHILSPPLAVLLGKYAYLPGEAGEALMGLWLTVLGVNAARWTTEREQAPGG
jgi:hypothetical protein